MSLDVGLLTDGISEVLYEEDFDVRKIVNLLRKAGFLCFSMDWVYFPEEGYSYFTISIPKAEIPSFFLQTFYECGWVSDTKKNCVSFIHTML